MTSVIVWAQYEGRGRGKEVVLEKQTLFGHTSMTFVSIAIFGNVIVGRAVFTEEKKHTYVSWALFLPLIINVAIVIVVVVVFDVVKTLH